MRKMFSVIIALVGLIDGAMAADLSKRPTFADYPAEVYYGSRAELQSFLPARSNIYQPLAEGFESKRVYGDFSDYPEEAADLSYRFAGRYVFLRRGCGIQCQTGLLVDVKTGQAVDDVPEAAVVDYDWRADSRLIIVNPYDPSLKKDDFSFLETTDYFVWDEAAGWQLIYREEWGAGYEKGSWGAVAADPTGITGFSFNQDDPEEALSAAVAQCSRSSDYPDYCRANTVVALGDVVIATAKCSDKRQIGTFSAVAGSISEAGLHDLHQLTIDHGYARNQCETFQFVSPLVGEIVMMH